MPKVKRFDNVFQVKRENSNVTIKYFIVPDGLGGIAVDDTLLVGESSPIGKILSSKNIGDNYEFNNTRYSVVDIFKNTLS